MLALHRGQPLRALPSGHRKRPVLGGRKARRTVLIPCEALHPHGAVQIPLGLRGGLRMVHDIVLRAVRAGREARVARAVDASGRVLVEDAAVAVLAPRVRLHGVGAHELEEPEAVKGRVDARGRVDDKVLARGRVDELLRAFVGGEAGVWAAVGDAFPGLRGDGDEAAVGEGRVDSPGVRHMGDAQVGGPGGGGLLPARVDVVGVVVVEEVGSVDGELVVRVDLALERVVCGPGVRPGAGQDKHAVVDGRAGEGALGVLQRRGIIKVRGRREDDVPCARDVVDLGRPQVGAPGLAAVVIRVEDDARLGKVPIFSQGARAPERDVVVGAAGEEVPQGVVGVGVLGHPRVADVHGEDGVAVGGVGGRVGAYASRVPGLRAGLVGIKGLAVDEEGGDGRHEGEEEAEAPMLRG